MRYLIFTLFLLTVLLFTNSKLYSQEDDRWIYIGKTTDDDKHSALIYYDSKTIEYGDTSTVIFWIKNVYDPYIYNTGLRKYIKYTLEKAILYCNSSKMQSLKLSAYFSDGTYETNNEPDIISSVLPGSIGELEFHILCK